MNVENKFDFIIFGASGFTGKLVVEYALEKYTDDKSVSCLLYTSPSPRDV